MSFLGRLLKYLFWLVVVSCSVATLRRIVARMGSEGNGSAPATDGPSNVTRLVRDPICGVHVAEGLSLSARQGGETLHFCSAQCRDKYLNEIRKLPASA